MEPHFVLTRKGVRFFSDHYNRVNEAREKRGLPTRKDMMGPNNGEIKDHPFLGRKFRMKGRDKDVFRRIKCTANGTWDGIPGCSPT